MKNREKMVLKTMCFFDIDFSSFFFDFSRFWLDFGRPRGSKNCKKDRTNRLRAAFGARFGCVFFRGLVLGGFWMDLGGILVDFEGCGPHC